MNDDEMQMNNVDRKKLEKYAPFIEDDKGFTMLQEMEMFNEKMDEKMEKDEEMHKEMMDKMEIPEMPEKIKVEIEGVEVITIKGEKGDVGERGEKGERGADGKNGKDGRDGMNGLDGRDGIDGKNGENGKDGSPDTAEQVKEKLLQAGLTIDDVIDLKETLEKMEKRIGNRPIFGGGGFSVGAMNFHLIDDETPSGVIDGNNTIFTIANTPSPASSLKVYLNGQRMRITEDYTFSGSTITFINAPLTGSILLVDYRT